MLNRACGTIQGRTRAAPRLLTPTERADQKDDLGGSKIRLKSAEDSVQSVRNRAESDSATILPKLCRVHADLCNRLVVNFLFERRGK